MASLAQEVARVMLTLGKGPIFIYICSGERSVPGRNI